MRKLQSHHFKWVVSIIAVTFLSLPTFTLAAPGKGQGPPADNGGGNNDNEGKPPEGAGDKKGDLYGDLWVIARDADGVPFFFTNDDTGATCVLPLAAEGASDSGLAFLTTSDIGISELTNLYPDGLFIPLDEECGLPEAYLNYVQEVEFGRVNVGRSPQKVLDRQYTDAIAVLPDAPKVDPAGRWMVDEDTTIDSPLQNLALYQELLIVGAVDAKTLPSYGQDDIFDNAGAMFGASADKAGEISLDMIVYQNAILGIPEITELPVVGDYVDYGAYNYNRSVVYPGCVAYYDFSSGTPVLTQDTIMNAVFAGEPYDEGNVRAFAQRADDARRVIEFMHEMVVEAADRAGESTLCDSAPQPDNLFEDANDGQRLRDIR